MRLPILQSPFIPGRLVARLRASGGYTVVELVTVCAILSVVLGSLTALFVSATASEIDQGRRFQAQQNARLALDKIRREAHCASAVTPAGQASTITMTLGDRCPSGTGSVTWCTFPISTNRYALYRAAGTTCVTTGAKLADYLTSTKIFNYTAPVATNRGTLAINLPVNITGTLKANLTYELVDTIILRNSSATG